MNNREKEILAILRRNPLIQQNEIADMLQISRSRVAAHIMDLMRKGRIKGKGYILTEQEYCVVVGTINMDIRGMADIRYPQAASHPGTIHCSAGGVGRNIAHNLALLGRDVHLLSVIGDDFYRRATPTRLRDERWHRVPDAARPGKKRLSDLTPRTHRAT